MPNPVSDFQVSTDGKTLAVLDKGSTVGVWNTDSHKQVLYLDSFDSPVNGIRFLNDSSLAVWTGHTFFCYDCGTGEKRWEYKITGDSFDDSKNLMLADGAFYIGLTNGKYLMLDSATGAVKNEIIIPAKTGYDGIGIVESKLSADGKKIAFRALIGRNEYVYGILDIATKNLLLSKVLPDTVKDIAWTQNNTLMVATIHIDTTESVAFESTEIISTDRSKIYCINPQDLSKKWNADFACNGVMIDSGFFCLGNDSVAYFSGNVATIYNLTTGTAKYSNNVNSSILDVSDRNGDSIPVYLTENGGYAYPAPNVDADAVHYKRLFADELRQVANNNGVYVRQALANEVIYYGLHVYDKDWTALGEDAGLAGSPGNHYMDDSCLAVLSSGNTGVVLDLFIFDNNNSHSRVQLEGSNVFSYQMLGEVSGIYYMGYNNGNSYNLVSVGTDGNNLKNEELFKTNTTFSNSCTMAGGKLIYYNTPDGMKKTLVLQEPGSDKKTEIALPEDIGFLKHAPVYYPEDNIVLVQGDSDYVVDVGSSSVEKVERPEGWAKACCYSDNNPGGIHAISDGKTILFEDKGGHITNSVICPGVTPIGMTFVGDELVVLYGDGNVYRYNKDDGSASEKIEVSTHTGSDKTTTFDYDAENQLLYIQMDTLTDVIDMESGVEIAHLTSCFGHHGGRDIFITTETEPGKDVRVGYYKRYSIEELIEKGKGILGTDEGEDGEGEIS